MIYCHTKFHFSISNAIKLEAKYKFHIVIILLFYISQENLVSPPVIRINLKPVHKTDVFYLRCSKDCHIGIINGGWMACSGMMFVCIRI
jgi:hypothetical protein